MKIRAHLLPFLTLLPFTVQAQTSKEEEALFDEESSEERFFKLEEEAVTIASKHAQSAREAPASITVLTAEDIFRYGFRDMGDVLRSVAGWYVSNGFDYLYSGTRGILLRGDQNTRILVLIDGHTQNEVWSSTSSIDETLGLDLNAVSRVEILQGPSSTLYGTNAFLGIVNIVTKSGAELSRASANLELGSFGYTRAAVASGQAKGGLDYHARANVVGASGRSLYFEERADTSESAGFTAPPSDRMSGYSAFLKLNWKNFRLLGQFSERLKYVPTAPYDTVLNSPNTFFEQKRFFLEARYNRDLSSKLSVMARAYYDGYRLQDLLVTNGEAIEEDTDGDGTPEVAYADPYVFRDFGSADWVGGELQAGLALVQTSKVRDQLYIGLESSHISTRSEAFVATSLTDDTPDESFEPVDIPRSAVAFGTYLQNELEVADAFNFVFGARFDYNSSFTENTDLSNAISPRGALIYRTRSDSTFKLIYAKGYRNPSFYEAYFRDAGDILDNPGLKPESIQNLELIYEYRFKKLLKVTLSNYYFRASDLIRQQTVTCDSAAGDSFECNDPTETRQQYSNVAALEGLGSEGAAQLVLPSGIQARATLAVQRSTDLDTREQLSNSPALVSNLLLSWPLLKDKAYLSGQLHYVAAREAVEGDEQRESVDPYVLANLVFATRELAPGVSVQAGVFNVFNQAYQDVAVSEKTVIDRSDTPILTIPADQRTFAFKLSYRY